MNKAIRYWQDLAVANRKVAEDAQAQRDKAVFALQGLLEDITDYQTINNLGGENNHWQVIARAVLKECGK